ncbi:MAG: ATPase [Ruminococcus sp.]|jgi:sugar (pentulose or hexulose) kinase|nr:ATPase [Ruminococcus sp.]
MTEKCFLGLELGSTRIKAVLINEEFMPVAAGSYTWENRFENGLFTYSEDDIKSGVQGAFSSLKKDVKEKFGEEIKTLKSVCISAMMHGFLAFDADMKLLTPFRTWRNVNTEASAAILSEKLDFNIPLRWSCAHLYQAIIDGEDYVKNIAHVTTLAGYVHYLLTGEKVLGVGDASGMFPIKDGGYDKDREDIYNALLNDKGFDKKLCDIFPKVLSAGENAGTLSESGSLYLDPTGALSPGIPFAPPEGDAGTGMTATNSVSVNTGNISAGTSVFAMAVLEKPLAKSYPEIDMVTTPDGEAVAMVHCNNCSGEIDAWVNLFADTLMKLGINPDMGKLYETFFTSATSGNAGGLMSYGFLSAEPIAGISDGIEMFIKSPQSVINLANFSKAILYSAICSLKIGMDILADEGIDLKKIYGHGGYFKSGGFGAKAAADAFGVPVFTGVSAGEGGAYGAALLAAYLKNNDSKLDVFLSKKVFMKADETGYQPTDDGIKEFDEYYGRFIAGLHIIRENN